MTASLAFARKVEEALRQLDCIPLFGKAPSLDLDHLSQILKEHLKLSRFSLSIAEASWRTPSSLQENLNHALNLNVTLFPLKGDVIWIMSREDLSRLCAALLGKGRSELHSELLQEGFYLYSILQALAILQEQPPFRDLTLRLSEEEHVHHKKNCYCVDLKISLDSGSCFGRLALSSSFLAAWQSHFSSLNNLISFSSLAKTLEIPVSIRVGSVLLSQQEWNSLEKGDLLLLDRGSYDPRHREGVASLSVGATPLFHVSVKENKIKLLEPALFYEEDMDKREATPEAQQEDEARSMAIKELPLFVTVELGRLRMTVEQLVNLVPGNFLELPVHPEQGVILSVNGQKIARGEIVHLGEALGVRISET